MKKTLLLFLLLFSFSSFGMIDSAGNEKVKLSNNHGVEVRKSVKEFIEKQNISIEMVIGLYYFSLQDPSTCRFNGKSILTCGNQFIEINILKKDYSIVDIYLNNEENS